MDKMDILKRSDKLAFYGVPGDDDTYTYHRMKGFSSLSTSKNPKEYSRQYIDEETERTDVVGYSPSMSFELDRVKGNAVHDDIIAIYDDEKVGTEAVRPIVIVDMSNETKSAISRDFSVIPDGEGNGTDAYVYSGTFKAAGEKISGIATSEDGWQTITFTADTVSE